MTTKDTKDDLILSHLEYIRTRVDEINGRVRDNEKQIKFINDELQKELRESFGRVESIIVKLIDQQKKMQLEQKGLENSYKTLVEVIASLSGNGLKDKFLRMQEKNDNKRY